MTESERINFLIDALAGGNAAKFGERIGVKACTIAKIRSENYPNGIKGYVDKIIETFPSVNRLWLITGEGYPGDLTTDLVRAHYEEKLRRADKVIDHLTRRIDELENKLEELK